MVDQKQHIPTEKARGGSTEHVGRYVLGISLALAILVMAVVLWR